MNRRPHSHSSALWFSAAREEVRLSFWHSERRHHRRGQQTVEFRPYLLIDAISLARSILPREVGSRSFFEGGLWDQDSSQERRSCLSEAISPFSSYAFSLCNSVKDILIVSEKVVDFA